MAEKPYGELIPSLEENELEEKKMLRKREYDESRLSEKVKNEKEKLKKMLIEMSQAASRLQGEEYEYNESAKDLRVFYKFLKQITIYYLHYLPQNVRSEILKDVEVLNGRFATHQVTQPICEKIGNVVTILKDRNSYLI